MTRELRQKEASDSFEERDRALIIAAPRFGKIKSTIDIINRIQPSEILVVYPRKDIEIGWESERDKWDCTDRFQYTTYLSLHKYLEKEWGLVVLDEIHEASNNQLDVVDRLKARSVLGLSGTCTKGTLDNIFRRTAIQPCYEYTIEQAVNEGILCDYTITIHKVPLDDKKKVGGKSEKGRFIRLGSVFDRLKLQKKDTFFVYIKQIQLIQGSISKIKKTKDLLEQWRNERVLVFCGTTEVADSLGVDVYHSKSKERSLFQSFCSGSATFNHLATIKMAQAGVTIVPIKKGLINYTSGNPEDCAQKICRFLGLEYDNPGKIADIHIVMSSEKFETNRMATALMFFDEKKIKYV